MQRYQFIPVSVIEIDNESVIKNIYRVYKTIYDVLLICRVTQVALPEPLKPEQKLFPCKKRLCNLLLQDVCFQRLTLFFQFVQPLPGSWCNDSLFDCRYDIFDPFIDVFQRSLQYRQTCIFSALISQKLLRQKLNRVLIKSLFYRSLYYKTFQRLLSH